MWQPKVDVALQSCHHANDQLWRVDLLLAEEQSKWTRKLLIAYRNRNSSSDTLNRTP